jgi:tetratricopeptide (TPR) repeat protein
MPGVFVSYRRTESESAAALKRHLEMRFGDDAVFFDIDDIAPGDDYRVTIADGISSCEAFLAVIGPEWLTAANEDGVPRIELEGDVLRQEIVDALDQAPVVIPVLVGGATMPAAEDLPEAIRGIASHQAVSLTTKHWLAEVAELMEVLRSRVASFRDAISVSDAQGQLYDLQQDYFEALNANDAAGALERIREASKLLDQVMPLHPQDPWLKAARGHVRKNESIALRRLEKDEEAKAALEKAAGTFETMTSEDPDNARGWVGLGRVVTLQGDRENALQYIDKAIEMDPAYQAARRDRQLVLGRVDLSAFSGWWEHAWAGAIGPPGLYYNERLTFNYSLEIAGTEGIALTTASEHFDAGDTVLRIDRSTGDRFSGQAIHPVTGEWVGLIGTLGNYGDRPKINLDWAGGTESYLIRPKRPGA